MLHRRATRLRHLTNGLLLAAVGWNLLRIWETVRQYRHAPPSVLPIGELDLFIVFIALAGLLKAWREAEGTERLVNTYQHMLARLHQLLAARPPADAPETTLRRFITDCENTLSAQNQEWGAGRG